MDYKGYYILICHNNEYFPTCASHDNRRDSKYLGTTILFGVDHKDIAYKASGKDH